MLGKIEGVSKCSADVTTVSLAANVVAGGSSLLRLVADMGAAFLGSAIMLL
jgi:hypothetical protein